VRGLGINDMSAVEARDTYQIFENSVGGLAIPSDQSYGFHLAQDAEHSSLSENTRVFVFVALFIAERR
jgi:hypothetical protein